ncbi:uncharacterized protein DDB_G0286591 [Orussus abietinus]|uniref:uncharacterized protein DDB_G0286591 n=1 Tax=Orussus abietinus TaxID=222816 RepID=UPI00062558DF|nr:uncharacterized protein DDB_G0286591 [Orussus abietinus]
MQESEPTTLAMDIVKVSNVQSTNVKEMVEEEEISSVIAIAISEQYRLESVDIQGRSTTISCIDSDDSDDWIRTKSPLHSSGNDDNENQKLKLYRKRKGKTVAGVESKSSLSNGKKKSVTFSDDISILSNSPKNSISSAESVKVESAPKNIPTENSQSLSAFTNPFNPVKNLTAVKSVENSQLIPKTELNIVDKYGRIDGYTERHLFMGKGGRMKELEFIQQHGMATNAGATIIKSPENLALKRDVVNLTKIAEVESNFEDASLAIKKSPCNKIENSKDRNISPQGKLVRSINSHLTTSMAPKAQESCANLNSFYPTKDASKFEKETFEKNVSKDNSKTSKSNKGKLFALAINSITTDAKKTVNEESVNVSGSKNMEVSRSQCTTNEESNNMNIRNTEGKGLPKRENYRSTKNDEKFSSNENGSHSSRKDLLKNSQDEFIKNVVPESKNLWDKSEVNVANFKDSNLRDSNFQFNGNNVVNDTNDNSVQNLLVIDSEDSDESSSVNLLRTVRDCMSEVNLLDTEDTLYDLEPENNLEYQTLRYLRRPSYANIGTLQQNPALSTNINNLPLPYNATNKQMLNCDQQLAQQFKNPILNDTNQGASVLHPVESLNDMNSFPYLYALEIEKMKNKKLSQCQRRPSYANIVTPMKNSWTASDDSFQPYDPKPMNTNPEFQPMAGQSNLIPDNMPENLQNIFLHYLNASLCQNQNKQVPYSCPHPPIPVYSELQPNIYKQREVGHYPPPEKLRVYPENSHPIQSANFAQNICAIILAVLFTALHTELGKIKHRSQKNLASKRSMRTTVPMMP